MSPCLPDEKSWVEALLVVHEKRRRLFGVERRQSRPFPPLLAQLDAARHDLGDRKPGPDLVEKGGRKFHGAQIGRGRPFGKEGLRLSPGFAGTGGAAPSIASMGVRLTRSRVVLYFVLYIRGHTMEGQNVVGSIQGFASRCPGRPDPDVRGDDPAHGSQVASLDRPAVEAVGKEIEARVGSLNDEDKQSVGRWVKEVLAPRGWRPDRKGRLAPGHFFSKDTSTAAPLRRPLRRMARRDWPPRKRSSSDCLTRRSARASSFPSAAAPSKAKDEVCPRRVRATRGPERGTRRGSRRCVAGRRSCFGGELRGSGWRHRSGRE